MENIIRYLARHLDRAKFRHSLGVARLAKVLAKRYRVSRRNAFLAGLLHDCGRLVPIPKLSAYCRKHNITPGAFGELYDANPFLLHGLAGAHIARTRFKVRNAGVLRAIRTHTVAGRRMSALAKIVFLADAAAPDRRTPGIASLRRKAFTDLDGAMRRALELKIVKTLHERKQVFPDAIFAWNEIIRG